MQNVCKRVNVKNTDWPENRPLILMSMSERRAPRIGQVRAQRPALSYRI